METSEKAENLLKLLWIRDVEKRTPDCGADAAPASDIAVELMKAGLALVSSGALALTHKGEEEARNCIRRHRLAERLFTDVLDVKKRNVHEPGCKFEHALHRGIEDNICSLLGHPEACPHGTPIPPGPCCKGARNARDRKGDGHDSFSTRQAAGIFPCHKRQPQGSE